MWGTPRRAGIHVSDDGWGWIFKRAVRELLERGVPWGGSVCNVGSPSRNALDYLPRKADDDCRQELRWLRPAQSQRGRAGSAGVAHALGDALSQARSGIGGSNPSFGFVEEPLKRTGWRSGGIVRSRTTSDLTSRIMLQNLNEADQGPHVADWSWSGTTRRWRVSPSVGYHERRRGARGV